MSEGLRIVVADDEKPMRDYLAELLPRLGHQVATADSGRRLIELCRASPPDLIITDIRMADVDGLEAVAEVIRERAVPVVLVSAYHDAELRSRAHCAHVMAYLVKPVKQADLETAIDLAMLRFRELDTLRREADDLRQALEDRKTVERAKGVIMQRMAVDEAEAFRRLRRAASDGNRKLVDVARQVLGADEVFAELDRRPSPGSARARGV